MKRYITPVIIIIVLSFFLFVNIQNSEAAIKAVATSVQEKLDLNITFRSYDLFQNAHEINEAQLKEALSSGTSADIIPGKLFSLFQQRPDAITIIIPFNGKTIEVELVSVNILTDDFSVVTGNNEIVPYTPGAYYRGIIRNNPNSLAAFSFFNNELYGVVSDDVNGNIVVGRELLPGNNNEYIIYADNNLLHSSTNYCNSSDDLSQMSVVQNLQPNASSSTVKCARMYYEVDHDIYLNNSSSVVNTTNWMTAVHNNVQTLYANDNINVALSQVYVWSTADPFTGANSSAQLSLFRTTRVSFNGDVAQLVAHDANNGGLAATINGLCSSNKYSYSDVNYSYSAVPTYSWTIEVITHEFGHILGSYHTHNCSWPGGAIDNCGPNAGYPTEGGCAPGPTPVNGGTIMSYCHLTGVGINFNNGFGPFPAAAIQNAINGASCLGTSCAVCPVPPHNDCSAPASLSVTTNCVYTSSTLCGATQSIAPITCNSRTAAHAYDVWYSVTPSQNSMIINCQSGNTTDIVLALYSGTCGSLTLMDCSDATTSGGLESITTSSVTAGVTYFVRVYDFNGATTGTDFGICISQNCIAATNDACVNAIALSMSASCNYVSGDLCSATQSISPASCSNYTAPNAFDLWYSITPAQNNVRITAQSGANTDIVLGLYSGSCGTLNLLNCTDTTGSGGIENINAVLSTGTTYYIRIYDWDGNQFGTDFQLCARYTCSPPNAPTGASAVSPTICAGGSTALNVTGSLSAGATWHWYTGSCGGTAAGTGSSITVSPSSTTTYYVRAENGTCYSICSSVGVVVTQIPATPTTATPSPATICMGASSIISVSGSLSSGSSWHWYIVSCGGTIAGTGTSITVSPSVATTYYVRAENGNCYSACQNTTVNITAIPSDPVSAGSIPTSVCAGTPSTISVTGTLSSGATWHWYSGSCGGTAAGTGVSITPSPSVTTTYYVRAENGSCYSSCQSAIVNVTPIPASSISVSPSPASICIGNSSTVSAIGTLSSGATWHWYTGTCGGTPAGTGSSITVTPAVTTTYYVRAENGSCFSACKNSTVAVINFPADPTSASPSPALICAGSSSIITVTGTLSSGATWHWYAGTCGGTPSGTGTSITVSPSSNTTYYVRAENGSCFSACQNSTVTVTPIPTSATSASPSPASVCAGSSSTISVTGTLSSGATWHWYSGTCGGTAAGTGASITDSPSATTTYYVRAENGNCYSTCKNTIVTVIPIPASPASASPSPASVCAGTPSTISVTGTLSPGSSWHWYTGTCGGTAAGTGSSIIVSPSAITTYYVRAEIGSCYSVCDSATLIASTMPNDPLSAGSTSSNVCLGSNTTLNVNGTLSAGASWHWFSGSCGGTAAGTGPSVIVFPPANTTYYVRAENGSCLSNCVSTLVNTIPIPADADSANSSVDLICAGDSAILHVYGTLLSGSNWYWYAGSCGGTLIGQGTTVTLTPFVTSNFYIRAEDANCHSNCISVGVGVNPLPVQPSVTMNNDTLTVPLYTYYQWYWSNNGASYNPSGNNQQEIAINEGFYFVVVTDINGCSATSDTVLYQDPNSIPENNIDKIISVFPNPVDDILNIKIMSGVRGSIDLKIFDDTGRLILTGKLKDDKTNYISLAKFADGIYQLLFTVEGKMFTEKIVKE